MDSGIEDELFVPSNLSHIAPRNSPAGQASSAGHNPSTHTNVRNLGVYMAIIAEKLSFKL